MGEYLQLRIVLDPAPPNMVPLILIRSENRWPTLGWIAKRAGPNIWDYNVFRDSVDDDEVHVYLIVR